MKKELLKMFYAFIIMMMFLFSVSNAQIVYTDIVPDQTYLCHLTNSSTKTYPLDLNNDGTNDFNIICFSNYAHIKILRVWIAPLAGNSYMTNSSNTAKKCFMNDTIGLSQVWNDTTTQNLRIYSYASLSHYGGEWINETDKYLGLELIVAGQVYFGWARLDVNLDSLSSTFTIKDYAYNSTPNQFILAGDTGLGTTGIVDNITSSAIVLYPNPAINILNVTLGGNNKNVEVTIIDISGNIIYNTTANDPDSYGENRIEVNTSDFAEGVYFVKIQSADFIGTKKLVVEK